MKRISIINLLKNYKSGIYIIVGFCLFLSINKSSAITISKNSLPFKLLILLGIFFTGFNTNAQIAQNGVTTQCNPSAVQLCSTASGSIYALNAYPFGANNSIAKYRLQTKINNKDKFPTEESSRSSVCQAKPSRNFFFIPFAPCLNSDQMLR